MTSDPRLDLRDITKAYPSVVANDDVSLRVMPGEIHAVLGENGAGKSTLMKIIYGVVRADAGEILWNGRAVDIASPAEARRLGIGMVFQHFSLFEALSVVENVALAVEGPFDLEALADRIRTVSERYGLALDPRRLVHSLSVGERQRVEIVRCLLQEPELLIMDEPTSVLTPAAVDGLFDTLRRLAGEGCSVLYISHKLDEIRALCHRATVMRHGRVTGTIDPARESPAAMARLMIGRDIPICEHGAPTADGTARLVLEGVSRAADDFGTSLRDVHLEVHGGEIVGIAGVAGNGQQELLALVSGESRLGPADAGRILLDGEDVSHLGAATRRDRSLAFAPEERIDRGAVSRMGLVENGLLTAHRQGMIRRGMILGAPTRAFAERCVEAFDVRCAGVDAQARSLSGGNLQKFIVGREILQEPRVLVAAQPTWGVDVGAAAEIRQALVELRDAGAAVLLVSEELEELMEISDRIAVITGGRLSAPVPTGETDVESIGLLMGGLSRQTDPGAAHA